MTLRGYTAPLSPDGRASLVPPPPWHYSGDFLIAEYRTDPDAVAALLPVELEPAEDPVQSEHELPHVGEQPAVTAQTLHVALTMPEEEAEQRVEALR